MGAYGVGEGMGQGRREIDREKPLPPQGFRVLPRRRVAEPTFSWTHQKRRTSEEDHERLTETSEAFVNAATSRLMARRLGSS